MTSPIGAVNSGTVSFTVPGVGAATSGTVTSGAASATLTVPAGQAGGSYTIQAVYSGTANLNTSNDNSHSLVISAPITFTSPSGATFVPGQPTYLYLSVHNYILGVSYTETGVLPSGVTLNQNILYGTPAAGTEGVYPITFTASYNGVPIAKQSFTLTVGPWPSPPPIVKITHGAATVGCSGGYVNFYSIPVTITGTVVPLQFGTYTATLGGFGAVTATLLYVNTTNSNEKDPVFFGSFPASGSTSVLQFAVQFPGYYYLNISEPPLKASSTARIALPACTP